MVHRGEWERLYAEFREVEEQLHQALPPVTEPLGTADPSVALADVDVQRADALIEEMRVRWARFQDYVRSH